MATVACPICHSENPAGQKFCGECASPLPRVCPQCGAGVTATQRFCGECAAPLHPIVTTVDTATSGASVPVDSRALSPANTSFSGASQADQARTRLDERRLITALFCDLVGFTPLSEQLDVEEVREIQAEYFSAMSSQIERYGGTVEKYAGDAVLALFGAPVAHEDDAERAVLCALGMQAAIERVAQQAQRRWGLEPAIRVGVNTGEVVSGSWDVGGRQDVAVTGDAVNTAARIQTAAEPGEVLVGAETMRLTRRRINYADRRDLLVKGKSGTVPTYAALGSREHIGERWEGAERATPLVGRDREVMQLQDAWMRAHGGEGGVVTLVGEAGVGKSRLVAELVDRVSAAGAVRIVRGRCLSYGQGISLWLIADLLRDLFGVREQDTLEAVREKVTTAITALPAEGDPESRDEAVDVLGEILGLTPGTSMVANAGAEIRRNALVRSIRLVLGALSQRAPLVVIVEDLHWIDPASEGTLREVVRDAPGLRMLVLATHRPGWTADWSDWGWPERITLRPLRENEAAALAGAVLGVMKLSPELERYVSNRAGGNPFFIEELLRALEEAGGLRVNDGQMTLVPGAAERLPSTLTEILLARLDRLESQVRTIAQAGSVIGRSFAVRLLAEVMGRERTTLEMPLTALQEAEIAFPRRGSDLEYVFKHAAMREAAYNTLVRRRRQELHLLTARAIAQLYASEEYAEMIAYHYARTDEHAEAAPWLERAGDRAAAIYSNESAVASYQEARRRVDLLGGQDRELARLDEKLADVLQTMGRYDDAIEVLERTIDTYRRVKDLEGAGRATALLGMTHRRKGTPEEGINRVQGMVDALAWSGPSAALSSLHLAQANLFFLVGRYREMLQAAERAAEMADSFGDNRLWGEAEMRRGTALLHLGHPEEAHRVLEGALPRIDAGGDLTTLLFALNNLGVTEARLGWMERMRRSLEHALPVAERIGNPDYICFVLGNLGAALLTLGDWEAARDMLDRGVLLARTIGHTVYVSNPLGYLGQLALWQGDLDEAAHLLGEALAATEGTGDRQQTETVQACLAELDLLEGRAKSAVARLEPVIVEEDANLGFLLPVLVMAYLDLDSEQGVHRAEELAGQAVAHSRDQPALLVSALRAQGQVLARQGRFPEAESVLKEGLVLARSMPTPYEEGRILFEISMMHASDTEQADRERLLREALVIFERLGAKRDMRRTQDELSAVRPA
jgi:adenylate cyclase